MLKIVKGDLIKLAQEGNFNIIVHGCNCFHTMGAGIAKQIKEQYPEAYKADLKTPFGDDKKLGTYSVMLGKRFNIINAYTQFKTRSHYNECVFDYFAFVNILDSLIVDYKGCHFGFPAIGTGLAGGNLSTVKLILEEFSKEVEKDFGSVTLVML